MAIQRNDIDAALQAQFEDSFVTGRAAEIELDALVDDRDPLDLLIMAEVREQVALRLDRGDSVQQIIAEFAELRRH